MDLDFLASFANKNEDEDFSYSKDEILKILKRIGVDTRFVSYYEQKDGDNIKINLYIENLRFSKFSKTRVATFNRYYPDIEVIRSSLFQKICLRASKTLANSLNPKDTVLIPKMENSYNQLLYIILEPYSRKYGIDFIEFDEEMDLDSLDDIDSVISPINLNQEVNDILNDIFDGKGIEWNRKNENISNYFSDIDLSGKNMVFPLINVPQEWINDFLGIENEYEVDYENDNIGESFMGFLSEVNPQFKENVLAASSFLEKHQK